MNRKFVLARSPEGQLRTDHFRLVEDKVPEPARGEVLIRTRHVSVDAANRAWMQGATYREALSDGMVMAAGGIGEVVKSNADGFAPGDFAYGETGWQEYAALPVTGLTRLEPIEEMTNHLSIFGIPGLTAYFGLTQCGQPVQGETVLVSAAAGAVGLFVGQVAKALGCKVVGIAGGPQKCAMLTERFGFDAAIDYKVEEPLRKAIRAAVPGGVDIYFDNVGGDILEAALSNMAQNGRIVCCGALAAYDGVPPAHGPRGIPGLLVTRRLTMRGFIVFDFYERRAEAIERLSTWVKDGSIKVTEDRIDGFERLPEALVGLFEGGNVGKRIVSF